MALFDYMDKHNWRFPFDSEDRTSMTICDFKRCENEEEIEWYKNLVIEDEGIEEWELFKEYCIETERLPSIFPPEE